MHPIDPRSECERLVALDRYDILDTPQEDAFDRITRLACRLMRVPRSVISLLDSHRQWFKAKSGVSFDQTARSAAICDAVVRSDKPLVILDALKDPRFDRHPAVVGEPFVRFYVGIPVHGAGGHVLGTLCVFDSVPHDLQEGDLEALHDLARIVEDELALRLVATTDVLTGALTRRGFQDEGSRALALAERHHYDLGCIVFDLDHFKSINDRFGHAAGDRVLSAVGATCAEVLRRSDIFGRMGGEEFAILLPHTSVTAASAVAEKLRLAIAATEVLHDGQPIPISASFGVAWRDDAARTAEIMVQRADEALYKAKGRGRNCTMVWQRPAGGDEAALRRRVLKAGRISFDGGRSSVDCTVRSLSETGAGVDVVDASLLPERMKLMIAADNESRACRVRARQPTHLELEFV